MRNMTFKKYTVILLSILFWGALQQAVAQEVAVEPQASITGNTDKKRGGRGWGVGVSYSTTSLLQESLTVMYRDRRHLSYRFITSQFDYKDSSSEKEGDSSYNLDVNFALGNDAFITNIHPFGGRFYFALGLTDFELRLGFFGSVKSEATEKQTLDPITTDLGTVQPDPIEVDFTATGNVGGSLAYEGIATYTGLGWGTKHPDKRGFGMRFEIGIIQMPKPKADLFANNFRVTAQADIAGSKPISNEALNKEAADAVGDTEQYERDLEAEAAQLNQFPVIELGFSYHF